MHRTGWKTPLLYSFLILSLSLSGCGTGPGPDLAGPQGTPHLTAYSGTWVLLRLDSDDLDAEFQEAMAGRPGASAGGMPGAGVPGGRGGGMTGGRPGGRPGGGRMPGGMPGNAGGLSPEEMQRVMRATMLIARTPTELTLILRPEAATLIQGEYSPLRMTLGADEISVVQGGSEYFAGAEWTDEGLIIERKVDRGGGVKDKIRVDDEGRLVVQREIDALRGGKVKGTLVYRKIEGTPGPG